MIIIPRRTGDSIVVGEILVTVLKIAPKIVRLKIEGLGDEIVRDVQACNQPVVFLHFSRGDDESPAF